MSLSSIARSKLTLSSSSNLHRWVLLKNSIIASSPSPPDPDPECATPPNSPTSPAAPSYSSECPSSSSTPTDPQGAFMFPRYYSYSEEHEDAHTRSSEALWLDTLLESLAHDEEDEVEVDQDETPIEEEEDDDDDEEADILSPMSSSDDLPQYYPPPQQSPLPPLPLALPFPFSHLDVLDDSFDDGDDPLKSSSCSSSTPSTSPSSSASSLPPSTPPSSPLRSWAAPKMPLPPTLTSPSHALPPNPHIYIDAYSDPLPFSHTFSYDIECPFVFHPR